MVFMVTHKHAIINSLVNVLLNSASTKKNMTV